jgi:Adenylate and Guanylate cyclase catalytic domain
MYACFLLQGTSELSLRIGLNSGPTTAGVLRGEKARFQLFGDVRVQSCSSVIPSFKFFLVNCSLT